MAAMLFCTAPLITLMLPIIGAFLLLVWALEHLCEWLRKNITLPNWINPEI